MTQRNKSGERKSPDAVLELWKEYSETAAPSVRDRLVLTLAPMVKYIVFRKLREIPARCEIELRRNAWAPRSLRRWERDIKKARVRFIGLYGRTPTNVELGDALAISHAELRPESARSPC